MNLARLAILTAALFVLPDAVAQEVKLTPRREIPSPVPGLASGRGPTGEVVVSIASPKVGEVVAGPDLSVRVDLSGFPLFFDSRTNSGQAIRVLLDEGERQDIFEASRPAIFRHVAEGPHTIRAFVIRPWGESIKDRKAFSMAKIFVGKSGGKSDSGGEKPVLTVNEPSGDLSGPRAGKFPLDFWLSNIRLSKAGARVRYSIDGAAPAELYAWRTVWFEPARREPALAPGKHIIKVELVDPKGQQMPGRFTSAEKEFTLK